jgi:hypothetical protein
MSELARRDVDLAALEDFNAAASDGVRWLDEGRTAKALL